MTSNTMFRLFPGFLVMVSWCAESHAQVQWQRTEQEIEHDVQVFHASKVLGLPTAQMLRKGNFEFEISHRFVPPVKDGYAALFGFDGPARMRLGVSYAVADDWVMTVGRSSIDANTDLTIKYRLSQTEMSGMPFVSALQIGAAWNPVETFRRDHKDSVIVRGKGHSRHFQIFAQLMIDFQPMGQLAVGVVPSFLYNRDIGAEDVENTFVLGTHLQLFLNRHWSIIGEYSPLLKEKSTWRNPAGLGMELETGAHIFEMFITNQVRINPAQFLAGAEYSFDGDNLRIGFMITRIL